MIHGCGLVALCPRAGCLVGHGVGEFLTARSDDSNVLHGPGRAFRSFPVLRHLLVSLPMNAHAAASGVVAENHGPPPVSPQAAYSCDSAAGHGTASSPLTDAMLVDPRGSGDRSPRQRRAGGFPA
jgi:hypothetical protein